MVVENVDMDVPIKFGDSWSDGFRDIRGADFVLSKRTLAQAYPNSAKRNAFRLKTVRDRSCVSMASLQELAIEFLSYVNVSY